MLRLTVLVCLLIFSCGPIGENPDVFVPPTDSVDQDALFQALSPLLYTDTSDPRAKAQNDIINYALDEGLDVRPTGSGLFLWIIEPGEGSLIEYGEQIRAHYTGRLLDNTVFDSSYDRGQPLQFRVGETIHGWNEALQKLRPGGKAVLLIPPALGYGEEGYGNLVPPNAVLRFDMVVLSQ